MYLRKPVYLNTCWLSFMCSIKTSVKIRAFVNGPYQNHKVDQPTRMSMITDRVHEILVNIEVL